MKYEESTTDKNAMVCDWNPRFLIFCRLHEVDPERIHSGDGTSPVKMVDFLDWVARMKRECALSTQGIIDSSRRVINQDAWTAWLEQNGTCAARGGRVD